MRLLSVGSTQVACGKFEFHLGLLAVSFHFAVWGDTVQYDRSLLCIIIKLPYNARYDWQKQSALSQNRCTQANFQFFMPRNFDKFNPNLTLPVTQTNAMETSYLSAVNMAVWSRRPLLKIEKMLGIWFHLFYS